METIILPLDINISDAIMSFQESGFQITQKVFDACGKPDYLTSMGGRRELHKREAEPAAAPAAGGGDRTGSGRAISLDGGDRQRLQGVGHPPETRKEEAETATPIQSGSRVLHSEQPIQNKGKSDFERMMEDLRRVVRIHIEHDFSLYCYELFSLALGPQFPGFLAAHAVPYVPQH